MTIQGHRFRPAVVLVGGTVGIIAAALMAAILLKNFVIGAIVVPSPSMESTLMRGDFILVNKLVYGSADHSRSQASPALSSLIRIPGVRSLRRGDVVVFELPKGAETTGMEGRGTYVKRCIAIPGDVLRIEHGKVYVNETLVQAVNDPEVPDRPDFRIPRKGDIGVLQPDQFREWAPLIRSEGHSVEMNGRKTVIDSKPVSSYTFRRDYCFVLGDNPKHSYDGRYWGLLPVENITGEAFLIYWSVDLSRPVGSLWDFATSVRWDRVGTLVR